MSRKRPPAAGTPTPERTTPSTSPPTSATTSAPEASAAAGATPWTPPGTRVGRIPVVDVGPVVDGGRWPARCVVGEAVPVTATVFREGHDAVAASVVLTDPSGTVRQVARMTVTDPGNDRYLAHVVPDAEGDWTFRVEGWSDPYGTWLHDAVIKVEADVDTELMLEEGARLLERAGRDGDRDDGDRAVLADAVTGLRDGTRPALARLAAGTSRAVQDALDRRPVREMVTAGAEHVLRVQRELALFGSWYEFFPRSVGATYDEATGEWTTGTLRTAAEDLPRIAAMGFDVAYLTPVHPIGTTNRKGRNNTLDPQPGDPGSPYAIGSADGGHDAIEPSLGTFEDFDAFVARARELGLEVALDLALQCSPDHPWVAEHPEWFTTRADGSIAYAENPPKKYQDIYPLNFDNDPEGIYREVLRVVLLWVEHGVTLFRVDNPHTKPVEFWEWLIAEVNRDHPEVVFLAEAFTRPAMMRTLAKVGFHQSYTYFTWRNTGAELTEYLTELTTGSHHVTPEGKTGTADYMRPSFWPTTHDILTPTMQYGGPTAFRLRAVLAATLVPTWGIYAGYELVENVARPGVEEQIDNEKYEFKPRDFARAVAEGRSLEPLLRRLNEVRRAHPALQRLRGITFHPTDDPTVLAYSRHVPAEHSPTGREDAVVVVVNLDPHSVRETMVHLDLTAIGLEAHESFVAHDLLSGGSWHWNEHVYVKLGFETPAHVVHVRRV
ncbi:alpha-1,4-glucan--maltose-1-phosphate maltosyltransferase [Thalassiella azotivora]